MGECKMFAGCCNQGSSSGSRWRERGLLHHANGTRVWLLALLRMQCLTMFACHDGRVHRIELPFKYEYVISHCTTMMSSYDGYALSLSTCAIMLLWLPVPLRRLPATQHPSYTI